MEAADVWVANDEGTEIIRAREIAAVGLDYNGNVTARLAGHDSLVVTLVAHRTHRDEHRPGDLHCQLLRIVAQLGDSWTAISCGPCTTNHAAGCGSANRCSSREGARPARAGLSLATVCLSRPPIRFAA